MFQLPTHSTERPWNKGKLIGQKPPLKLHEIWAIRIRLQLAHRVRDEFRLGSRPACFAFPRLGICPVRSIVLGRRKLRVS